MKLFDVFFISFAINLQVLRLYSYLLMLWALWILMWMTQIMLLRSMLSRSGPFTDLASFDAVPLPLDPAVAVVGVVPDTANIYKSALSPLGLEFVTVKGERYRLIYKQGDDLRQDQFVMQLIRLMDTLLKKQNLDLKITPYHIFASSDDEGAEYSHTRLYSLFYDF